VTGFELELDLLLDLGLGPTKLLTLDHGDGLVAPCFESQPIKLK
jgi:hypothetical protein